MSQNERTARISEHSLGVITQAVLDEFRKASENFPAFNSGHEGYAVLKEEMDELWEAVKLNQKPHPERPDLMQKEAMQVAAMAIRFLHDVSFNEKRTACSCRPNWLSASCPATRINCAACIRCDQELKA